MTTLPWERPEAACRSALVSFFPDDNLTSREKRAQEDAAKQICLTCPILELCQDYAILNENYGVWGGMSELERRKARAKISLPNWQEYRQHSRLQEWSPIPQDSARLLKEVENLEEAVQPRHFLTPEELSAFSSEVDDLLSELM